MRRILELRSEILERQLALDYLHQFRAEVLDHAQMHDTMVETLQRLRIAGVLK